MSKSSEQFLRERERALSQMSEEELKHLDDEYLLEQWRRWQSACDDAEF